MKIDPNDPRWTAYALGELENENDRVEIEAALDQSAEARCLVEEIRNAARMLTAELQDEPVAGLSAEQRQQLELRIDGGRRWFSFRYSWVLASVASAAVLLAVVLAGGQLAKHGLKRAHEGMPTDKMAVSGPARQPAAESASVSQVPVPQGSKQAPAHAESRLAQGKPTVQVSPSNPPAHAGAQVQGPPQARGARATPARETAVTTPKSPAAVLQTQPIVTLEAPRFAALTGTVVDTSGAAIPGAHVVVRNDATATEFKTVTGEKGTFSISPLTAGTYGASVNVPGFKQINMRGLVIQEGVSGDIRVTMEVGALNEVVTVTAGAVVLDSKDHLSAIISNPPATQLGFGMGSGDGTGPGRAGGTGTGVGTGWGPGQGPGGIGARGVTTDVVNKAREASTFDGAFRYSHPRSIKEIAILAARGFNTEAYDYIRDNPFQDVAQKPLSTFSIDVDTASYSNMRRFLNRGQLPPKDSVRIEELINYFDYDYAGPNDGKPFSANFEVTEAPWNPEHRLLRIGMKAREVRGNRAPSNLVFLLDVSGSMADANKLPLVKESMSMLLDQLTENDRVAIVVYATESRLVLPSTSGDQKVRIRAAIDGLQAGGTTNGAAGIQLAYQIAQEGFIRKGINRVILATDGDFNVGITNRGDLTRLIEDKRKSGIFLSALGFGMGNLKDSTLELLADKGNGNYAYIDTLNEARKVLVEQLNSTLVTIAKDVKIQIEFNPAEVGAYRLIGYEDRRLASTDFNNDQKDAGEAGAGHAVTVFYELVPSDKSVASPKVDPLKYQRPVVATTPAAQSGEMLTMKIRFKEPDQDESSLLEYVARDAGMPFTAASRDFKFAAAVAAFGMYLRDSPYKGHTNLEDVLQWARQGLGYDPYGYRHEFIQLLYRAASILR